jgi:hypothetical protein
MSEEELSGGQKSGAERGADRGWYTVTGLVDLLEYESRAAEKVGYFKKEAMDLVRGRDLLATALKLIDEAMQQQTDLAETTALRAAWRLADGCALFREAMLNSGVRGQGLDQNTGMAYPLPRLRGNTP